MPHDQNRENKDFSRFDNMTDEELQHLLQEDMNTPEGQDSDYEMLLYIMEVLAKRKESRNEFSKTPDEAFVSFQQHYLPLTEEEDTHKAIIPSKTLPRWLRRSLSVAAVIAVVVFGSMTTSVFGFDIWAIVGKWAQETFHFGSYVETEVSEPSNENNLEFSSLLEALHTYGITSELVPAWIPHGFDLTEIHVNQTPAQISFVAIYKDGNDTIQISIRDYMQESPFQIEKSESLIELYENNDQDYYIFEDNEKQIAAWTTSNYECFISGDITVNEIKTMLDSIPKE